MVEPVKNALRRDAQVDPEAIAVAAEDGRVTLRGTVGSLREKRQASQAAERAFGVVAVDNQLEVRALTVKTRHDAELRADVLQALMLDGAVPETVDARVADGLVTLTGKAAWQYERETAELVARNAAGGREVANEVVLEHPQPPPADELENAIARALRRNGSLAADRLTVTTDDGTVTISGTVRSWAEHDDALAAALAAPGVTAIRDRMTVDQ